MLTPGELVEMRALTTRAQRGAATHEDWATLAALTLIWEGDPTIKAIADGGYAKFVRIARPHYANHDFTQADYRRIFKRVCAASTRIALDWVN